MTNIEFVAEKVVELGLAPKETVEKTLANGKRLPYMSLKDWGKYGYRVRKGEKAMFYAPQWDSLKKYENGKWTIVRDDNGKTVLGKPFRAIFSAKQVEKIPTESKKEEQTVSESAPAVKPVKTEKKTEAKKSATKSAPKAEKKLAKSEKKSAKKSATKGTKKSATKKLAKGEKKSATKSAKQNTTKYSGTTAVFTEDGIKYIKKYDEKHRLVLQMRYDLYEKVEKAMA